MTQAHNDDDAPTPDADDEDATATDDVAREHQHQRAAGRLRGEAATRHDGDEADDDTATPSACPTRARPTLTTTIRQATPPMPRGRHHRSHPTTVTPDRRTFLRQA